MERASEETKKSGFASFVRMRVSQLQVWMQPEPADHWLLQGVKFIFKSMALALMIIFSPVLLVLLLFVFFAAV